MSDQDEELTTTTAAPSVSAEAEEGKVGASSHANESPEGGEPGEAREPTKEFIVTTVPASSLASAGVSAASGTANVQGDVVGQAINDGEHLVDRKIDDYERSADEDAKKEVEAAGDNPILSPLAKADAWVHKETAEATGGFVRAGVNAVGGLATTSEHIIADNRPIDLDDVKRDLTDPDKLAKDAGGDDERVHEQAGEGVISPMAKSWNEGRYGDAFGQLVFQGVMLATGGEAGETGEAVDTTQAVTTTTEETAGTTTATSEEVAPSTLRSPTGPTAPSKPVPDVAVVDPPAQQDAAAAPDPAQAGPDAAAPDGAAPKTLRSEFDPNKVPSPAEVANRQVEYPPDGGADGPWQTKPVTGPLDRFGYQGGRFMSPVGTPLEQRAIAPVYDPDAAELMGKPPDADVGPKNYEVYDVKPGTNLQTSQVAPAYAKPGGGVQVFTGTDPVANTGPRVADLNGEPNVYPDDPNQAKPVYKNRALPNDRSGGPLSFQYGTEWKVDTMSPEEAEEIRRLEEQQAKQPRQFDDL